MSEFTELGAEIVWQPTQEYLDRANLTNFMSINDISDFTELMERSTHDPAWFSEAVLNYLDIEFYKPYLQVVDLSRGIAWPRWCIGGKLNIVHNCLDKYIGSPTENLPALIWESEEGITKTLTYADLYRQVNQAANALRQLGLGKGDPIGLFMPMVPEIVVALLAIAKIGGIILPLFSGYGSGAIATRLIDAGAKAMFTADGFFRRGKPIDIKPIADEAAAQCPTISHMIVFQRTNRPVSMKEERGMAPSG